MGHKDLDKWLIYLSFHFLGFFHWTVILLFYYFYYFYYFFILYFIFCAVFIVLLTVKAIYYCLLASLSSRRFEVVGERENGRARGRHTGGVSSLPSGVSFSRARFFLCPLLPNACYAGYLLANI